METVRFAPATRHLSGHVPEAASVHVRARVAGRTSFVIAHRLSTILAADVIFVLQGGRLVDRGSHHELLERGGLYRTLYDHQFNLDRLPAFAEVGSAAG